MKQLSQRKPSSESGVLAVILDWAGTSIDYGCMAPTKVFVEVFAKYGIDLSLNDARGPMGLAKRDHVQALLLLDNIASQWKQRFGKNPDTEAVDTIYAELEPTLARIAQDFSTPIPGVTDFVNTLKHRGIKIGSTTGYVSKMMDGIIPKAAKLGFSPDSIVTPDCVPAGRPYPWMIYENAKRLGVYPMSRIIKIGDTVADIQEGLNSGVWTIALTKSGNEVGLSEEEISKTEPSALLKKINAAQQKLSAENPHYIAEGIWECLPIVEEINNRIKNGEKP